MISFQIDRRLYKKKESEEEAREEKGEGEEGGGKKEEEVTESDEDSSELMARLTNHIYNSQGEEQDRWVEEGEGHQSCHMINQCFL